MLALVHNALHVRLRGAWPQAPWVAGPCIVAITDRHSLMSTGIVRGDNPHLDLLNLHQLQGTLINMKLLRFIAVLLLLLPTSLLAQGYPDKSKPIKIIV